MNGVVPDKAAVPLKILVFIEHDIIIRHFVHSGVFADLAARPI